MGHVYVFCTDICIFLTFLGRTERDATNWSSEKLKDLLVGLCVENDEGKCEVTELSKAEGEASINNRKGKLIFFYEWNLKAKWKGERERNLGNSVTLVMLVELIIMTFGLISNNTFLCSIAGYCFFIINEFLCCSLF